MDPIIHSYSWDSDEETEHSTKPKNTKEKQLLLKTRNGNIRSNGKQITPRAEEGYCNEATRNTTHVVGKNKAIPVIIGVTGTISKSFIKYICNIPGNHEVKDLQKTAILGTAHILRKVLM